MEFHRLDQSLGKRSEAIIDNWFRTYAPTNASTDLEVVLQASILYEDLLQAEANWPYYKVWPDYLDMFRKTRLDNIPATELKFPFNAWTVLLPTTYELTLLHRRAAAFTLCFTDKYDRARLTAKAYDEAIDATDADRGIQRQLHFSLDTIGADGQRDRSTVVMMLDNQLARNPTMSVEECITLAVNDFNRNSVHVKPLNGDPDIVTWNDSLAVAMRIMLSVAFIATGEYRFVHRDVLAADLAKFTAATAANDRETIKRLGDKADRRRGETGHTIGKFHAIDLLTMRTEPVDGETDEQRELRYQHLRSGHFHAYWCGPGRKEKKVKFLVPVVVRPDLPVSAQSPARLIR